MSALIDLTGRKFGKLKVIGIDHIKRNKYGSKIYWRCICECGNEKVTSGDCLKGDKTKSCGKCRCSLNIEDRNNCYGITSRGVIFKFDYEDYDKIKGLNWFSHHGYIVSHLNEDNRKTIYLHRFVIGLKDDRYENNLIVDHINHDKTDNRKCNLRIGTSSQNNINRKTLKNNTSGCPGVTYRKEINKWRVRISVNGKRISVGDFDTYEAAVKARRDAEMKYHKDWAYLKSIKENT